jgi:hypothetical protein
MSPYITSNHTTTTTTTTTPFGHGGQLPQTYSSTRSLCSIERSSTALTDQYQQDENFERAHDCQNNSRR